MSQRIGAALACLLCLGPGCSVDVHDGMGPRVPIPNVSGRVTRAGQPVDEVDVELRALVGGEVVDSVSTDSDGTFEFANVAVGDWEVKASGENPSDFDSVTREFHLARLDTLADLAALDIFAYGASPMAPPEGAVLATPNPFQPIAFRWTVPAHEFDWGRVYVYGANGEAIWFSSRTGADSVLWNGLGSEGDYEGRLVSAGDYAWRLKFGFPDGQEGRTAYQSLELE